MAKKLLAKINIRRPCWDSVLPHYQNITKIKFLGGDEAVYKEIGISFYGNSCATRMSYAFNYGGMPLNNQINASIKSQIGGTVATDANNHKYITGAANMGRFLVIVWGEADMAFGNFRKKPEEWKRCNEWLTSFSKNGVIVLPFFNSKGEGITGHTTLWNGSDKKFIDFQHYDFYSDTQSGRLQALKEYIDRNMVKYFYFWELC